MLNSKGQRELAYVVVIDHIIPIEGADRIELAMVNGWQVVVQKGQFSEGDKAVYFEIDSKLPNVEPFTFMAKYKFAVKTQKFLKGTVLSQGLLMDFASLGWADDSHNVGDFVTKELNVTYHDPEDNARKSESSNTISKNNILNKQPFKFLMRFKPIKKLLLKIFKKNRKGEWPAWVVKTDEERIQNMPGILSNEDEWIATEKIDGMSATYTMKRSGLFKNKLTYYVCSRNVCFAKEEVNPYFEISKKYKIEDTLKELMNGVFKNANYVTIQGEIYGSGIQKRDYTTFGHNFMAFNLIADGIGRMNSCAASNMLMRRGIPFVPIIDKHFKLKKTVNEMLEYSTGESVVDGGMREGVVFRSMDGKQSFKAVSNEYLMKYHG